MADGPDPQIPLRTARWHTALLVVLLVVAVATSFWLSVRNVSERAEQIALESARSLFRVLVAARAWNAAHGGVYAPVSDRFQPNPYLVEDPLRDLETREGLRLTKINPAYMTRMIAEILDRRASVRIHLTSLNPLRPENRPWAWEERALRRFERGDGLEYYEIAEEPSGTVFRYMAPLRTEGPCLRCHRKQGYEVGDVRGGLSVTIPYTAIRSHLTSMKRRIALMHGGFVAFGLSLLVLMHRRLGAKIRELIRSQHHAQTLEGLLPICAFCKKIRVEGGDPDDPADWHPLERYIQERSDATFSHGICPECLKRYYSDDSERPAPQRPKEPSR